MDFSGGNQLMHLERSRSAAYTIPFWAFAIGLAFRSPAACRGAVHFGGCGIRHCTFLKVFMKSSLSRELLNRRRVYALIM